MDGSSALYSILLDNLKAYQAVKRQGLGIFLFTTASRTALGPTRLPIQWVKRPGRGAIPPVPQYAFMAWCSVKAQRQLYFLPLQSCYRKATLNMKAASSAVSFCVDSETVFAATGWTTGVRFSAGAGIFFSFPPRPDWL
jgi:hypothetical protein